MNNKKNTLKELIAIPGVGKSIALDLRNIGIRNVNDLAGRSPREMYEKLNRFKNVRNDRCVLYSFRCAVYYASESKPKKEKLKWWYWKDKEYIDK